MKFIVHQSESRGNLRYHKDGAIGYLSLDNPSARNAMSINMMVDFPTVLGQIELDQPTVLIVRGADQRYFCSGGDLRDVRRWIASPQAGAEMCRYMTEQLQRLYSLPVFIIVVIDGAAIGGGAELSMIGDYILAEQGSTIGFVQASLGVTTGWGGAKRLIQRVGRLKATQVLTLAQRNSAQQALSLGIVDDVTEDVDHHLAKLLNLILSRPTETCHTLMRMMRGEIDEQSAFEKTWASPDHLRALGL